MEIEEVKKKSRILLISADDIILESLKNKGYQNIDHFKSRILASRYYEKYPQRLSQYHAVILGSTVLVGMDYLEKEILYLEKKYGTILLNLKEEKEYQAEFNYGKSKASFTGNLDNLLDKLAEFLKNNHSLERNYIPLTFVPIPVKENLNVIVPKFKRSLKILYLSEQKDMTSWSDIVKELLGVKITFLKVNKEDITHFILNSLGDYDIIIGSKMPSLNLLGLGIECQEQLKKSGRCQTLLMTTDSNPIIEFNEDGEVLKGGFASVVDLKYVFSNKSEELAKEEEIKIPVLREDLPYNMAKRSTISNTLATISVAVNLYDEKLKNLGYLGISDNDLKNPLDYQIAYEEVKLAYEEEKEEKLKALKIFDNLMLLVSRYLSYQKRGLIKGALDDLDIIEYKEEIIIESYYNERPYIILTIPLGRPENNLRTFKMQIPSKKGMLTSPLERGIYTPKYEKVNGVPERLSDIEAGYLLNLVKKVEMTLSPIINEAIALEGNKGQKRSRNRGQKKR